MIRRRTLTILTSHLGVLLVGFAIGSWVAVDRIGRANAGIEEIGTIQRMSAYLYSQRMLGDPAAYEAALNDYVSSLERRRALKRPLSDERVLATDLVLAHTRLALLAEQRGDTATSKAQFERALSQCPVAFFKACSPDGLRQVVLRLDRDSLDRGGQSK
jgi:hypothetical protein